MAAIDLSAMLGMKSVSGVVEDEHSPEKPNLLNSIVLPSQIKYNSRYRKRKRKDTWRKYHDAPKLKDRLGLRARSQLDIVKDNTASFLWGPAQLSVAAKAWERRQQEKKRLAKLHRERMEFAALTLPRFAERMAQIREERLLRQAKILAEQLFQGWRVFARQQRIVRTMFGKTINERLKEMLREWRHTAKTMRHFRNMVRRSNKSTLLSIISPWKRYTKYIIKRRRYMYAVYISSNVYEKNMSTVANIMHVSCPYHILPRCLYRF